MERWITYWHHTTDNVWYSGVHNDDYGSSYDDDCDYNDDDNDKMLPRTRRVEQQGKGRPAFNGLWTQSPNANVKSNRCWGQHFTLSSD